jgi:hypothetical protein
MNKDRIESVSDSVSVSKKDMRLQTQKNISF